MSESKVSAEKKEKPAETVAAAQPPPKVAAEEEKPGKVVDAAPLERRPAQPNQYLNGKVNVATLLINSIICIKPC